MVEIIERPKEINWIQMVLRNLQPRYARHLMSIPFQDFISLVQAKFDVEEGIIMGLWTETTASSSNPKGKKVVHSINWKGELGVIGA